MLARIPALRLALGALLGGSSLALGACAHRAATCGRVCDDGFACVAGECLKAATVSDVEALDRFGLYQTRRLVLSPVEVVRLAPGSEGAASPSVATLGRERDAASILLLRFSLELPRGASVVQADLVLDRAPSFDADPSPVLLHASRIAEAWDARAVSWGRAPRIEDVGAAVTTIDDARTVVRIDVRPLVRRWRRHAPDDQGIALVADRASATGIAFALSDGHGSSVANAPVLSIRGTKDAPPVFHAGADEAPAEPAAARGPRLELYVKP